MVNIINWSDYKTKADWLKARNELSGATSSEVRVGASEVSTITGSNPYKSLRRLTLEKAGIYSKPFINDATVMGHLQEPNILRYWEGYNHEDYEQTLYNVQDGVRLRKLKQAEFFLTNDKYPNFFVSLDAIAEEPYHSPITGRLVDSYVPHECKYIRSRVYKSWEDGIPQSYLEQITVQMGVSESDFGIFLPLLSEGDKYTRAFNPLEIDFDRDLFEYINEKTGEFCLNVAKIKLLKAKADLSTDEMEKHELECMIEEAIPLDSSNDTLDIINETTIDSDLMYVVDPDLPDDSELDSLMERYLTNGESIKMLDYDQNLIRSTLTLKADGYNGIESERFKATIRSGNGGKKGKYFKVTKKKG